MVQNIVSTVSPSLELAFIFHNGVWSTWKDVETCGVKYIELNTDAVCLHTHSGIISMIPIPYYVNLCHFIFLDFSIYWYLILDSLNK